MNFLTKIFSEGYKEAFCGAEHWKSEENQRNSDISNVSEVHFTKEFSLTVLQRWHDEEFGY